MSLGENTDPGYQNTAAIIEQAKRKGHSHSKIVRRLFAYEHPFTLATDTHRGFDIFLAVADNFHVPIYAIRAAGSGQLGYSFIKQRSFIPGSSDLDLAIVSSDLFSQYCLKSCVATSDYRDLTGFRNSETHQAFIQYLAKGYFRPDFMPTCPSKQLWFSFFENLSRKHGAVYSNINCGIYISEDVFERKQCADIQRYLSMS
jgi:hypothetical protein